MKRNSRWLNNILLNIVVLLFTVIVCLSFLEIAFTVLVPRFNPKGKFNFYENDQGIPLGEKNFSGRFWHNDGDYNISIHINQYGFRDKKDLKKSTKKDIFAVGDSFTFGYGVEEEKRFSNLLESILSVTVYNIGMPGNFEDYNNLIKYAQKNGATIGKLIVGVCMENDLADYSEAKAKAYKVRNKTIIWRIKRFLDINSTTYNILAYITGSSNILKYICRKIGLCSTPLDIIPEAIYNVNILISSVKKLADITKLFDTLIVIIPSRALWIGNHQKRESDIHNKFISLIRKERMACIDLRQPFEEDGPPLQYYFPHDGHWNEKGHHKAAEVIKDYYMKSPMNTAVRQVN